MSLNPTTLQSLITQIRNRIDLPTSQYISDAEITTMLNASLAELDRILISKFNDYKITATIVSVTPNTNYIQLPLDFVKLRGLDVWFNPTSMDGYITSPEYSFKHRNKKIYPSGGVTSGIFFPYCIEHRLQGQQIVLLPPQIAANYQYRLWYSPDFIPLVNTTDTLQTYMDTQSWSEYGVLDVCIKILAKQGVDASTFQTQKEQQRESITKLSAPNREAGEPKSLVDSSSYYEANYGYWW